MTTIDNRRIARFMRKTSFGENKIHCKPNHCEIKLNLSGARFEIDGSGASGARRRMTNEIVTATVSMRSRPPFIRLVGLVRPPSLVVPPSFRRTRLSFDMNRQY
jgi:hypothetical protein